MLARSGRDLQEAVLLADLLSIPAGNRYPSLDMSPQRRRQKTLDAMVAQLGRMSAHQPVLMIFEDAHWSDPTSRELLELAVDLVQSLAVFLIITFRPEFTSPWSGRPHVTTHLLNRLTRREGSAIVNAVAGGASLPAELVDQIVTRTDGVPLFIEELTKAVLESAPHRHSNGQPPPRGALPVLEIPTTLHASLMARLDRLGGAREIAEVGAALGREFSHELIGCVATWSEAAGSLKRW